MTDYRRIFCMLSAFIFLSLGCVSCSPDKKVSKEDDISDLIKTMISSRDIEAQKEAATALENIVISENGIGKVVEQLTNEDADIRKDTAVLLGVIFRAEWIDYDKRLEIIPNIVNALNDEDASVRQMACSALGDLIFSELLRGNSSPLGSANDQVVSAIGKLLNDNDPDVRVKAANNLAYLGPLAKSESVTLQLMLKDEDFLVRLSAACSLAKIGSFNQDALPVLIEGLKTKKTDYENRILPNIDWIYPSDIRVTSAIALGLVGPNAKSSLPELYSLLNDTDEKVRTKAAEAIAAIEQEVQ